MTTEKNDYFIIKGVLNYIKGNARLIYLFMLLGITSAILNIYFSGNHFEIRSTIKLAYFFDEQSPSSIQLISQDVNNFLIKFNYDYSEEKAEIEKQCNKNGMKYNIKPLAKSTLSLSVVGSGVANIEQCMDAIQSYLTKVDSENHDWPTQRLKAIFLANEKIINKLENSKRSMNVYDSVQLQLLLEKNMQIKATLDALSDVNSKIVRPYSFHNLTNQTAIKKLLIGLLSGFFLGCILSIFTKKIIAK